MASASISELIMFIAAVTVAAGVATTLTLNVSDISSSVDQRSLDLAADIDTGIVIISDAGSPDSIYDSGTETVTILVKNTGGRTLPADTGHFDILVDGQYVAPSDLTATVVSDGPDWKTGEVVQLNISTALTSGDHRVTVIVDGDSDVIDFEVP